MVLEIQVPRMAQNLHLSCIEQVGTLLDGGLSLKNLSRNDKKMNTQFTFLNSYVVCYHISTHVSGNHCIVSNCKICQIICITNNRAKAI